MLRILLKIILGLSISPWLYAAPESYSVLTPQTAIELSWRAFGGTSQAHLDGVTGSLLLDAGNDMHDSISVRIPAATLQASNSLLTYQLQSGLFFDTAHYPTLSFSSTRVVAQGAGRYRIFGLLQVKNVQRPVVLEASLDNAPALTSGQNALSLRATTVISRAAFNMDKFEAVVDDSIAIEIKIRARIS
ncbi:MULTISPECIES: YceI family protein [Enterobacteriaceae]|uniref:YceI family protein n=1 Tax=Enterobacteriaceae TaxID=543 RepID=UPI000272A017|nr:YceI family protein [Enterobacter sp. Ag1]EJF31941.1 YceI family protein [Enterobacter sp. Ag1]